MPSAGKAVIIGPASWNTITVLEHLPEPRPHMQFALDSWQTLGGTSAGKALHLASLGWDVSLFVAIGDDDEAAFIESALAQQGITTFVYRYHGPSERHQNLMTPAGERVSLYLSTPPSIDAAQDPRLRQELTLADAIVADLSDLGRSALDLVNSLGLNSKVWTDLHDFDGVSSFHAPFLQSARHVLVNDDKTDDPRSFLQALQQDGDQLVVCTLGKEGSIGLPYARERAPQQFVNAAAASVNHIADTNGAGDAYMAGLLDAVHRGAPLHEAMQRGSQQATVALGSVHLHPAVSATTEL